MLNWLLWFVPTKTLVSHMERRASVYSKRAAVLDDAIDGLLTEQEIAASLVDIQDKRESRGRYCLPSAYTTAPWSSEVGPDKFCNNCQQWGHIAAICTNPTSLPILEIPDDETR